MRGTIFAAAFATALSACSMPPEVPEPSSAQRFNSEGLRRMDRGDVDGAREMFSAALKEAELVDDLVGEAEAWNNLGAMALSAGRPDESRRLQEKALAFHLAAGSKGEALVRTRTNLGSSLLLLGDPRGATTQFEAALVAARDLPADRSLMARVGLASAALQLGDDDRAERLAREAERAAHDTGEGAAEAGCLAVESGVLEHRSDAAGARERLERALDIDRRREEPYAVRDDLRSLARLVGAQGDRERRATLLVRAARVSRWLGDREAAARDLADARGATENLSAETLRAIGDEDRLLAESLSADARGPNRLPPDEEHP
jgi:tetratricopeptide (TPR) repeat protein